MSSNKQHQPVLLKESLELLAVKEGQHYLDATFGRGGHSQAILNQGGLVIGLDFDQEAIEKARESFKQEIAQKKLILIQENFKELSAVLENLEKTQNISLAGVIFDFGTSTEQLTSSKRGFSFSAEPEAILDMRMNQDLGVKAGDLLIVLSEKQLANLLFEFGGEKQSRQIAKAVARVKRTAPNSLQRVGTLLEIVERVKGTKASKLHPATKTFQALRIAVNDELNNIQQALPAAFNALQTSSAIDKRLVCISFHEGEDRLVKKFFREQANQNLAKLLTKKAIIPSSEELKINPRARSAKLRALVV